MAPGKKRKINAIEKPTIPTNDHEQGSDSDDSIDLTQSDPSPQDIWKLMIKIHRSQQFLSNKFDTYNERTIQIEEENKILKKEVTNLKSKIVSMEGSINQMHHELYSKHISISNIPTTMDENLETIIMNVADTLNIKINPINIMSCKRGHTTNQYNDKENNKPIHPPPIIVEFNTQKVKQEFMDIQKSFGPLTTTQLNFKPKNTAPNRIYFNDLLSATNRKILYETQKIKRTCNIKFVWARNGNIYLRKNEGSQPIRIRDLEHLINIEQQFKNSNNENLIIENNQQKK